MTQTIELSKWHSPDTDPEVFLPTLFGKLVELAFPIVKHYHSDLYRDAQWLQHYAEDIARGEPFYYGIREHGTHIGTDSMLKQYNSFTYKATVQNIDKVWTLTLELIDPDPTNPSFSEANS